MPKNIESIKLWKDNPLQRNNVPLVKISFIFPCEWTVLDIDNLKDILKEWIKGEELAYPPKEGFQGRWMLFEEIKKVFENE